MLFALLLVMYTVYLNVRARKAGLPPVYNPFTFLTSTNSNRRYSVTSRSGGLFGWVNNKMREWRYKRNRSAAGAYEGQGQRLGSFGSGRQAARGRGLDPDDAWDARVGAEADVDPYNPDGGYYEEELGLSDTSYKGNSDLESGRGRQLSREHDGPMSGGNQAGLNERYNREMGISSKDGQSENPFADANAVGAGGSGSTKTHMKGEDSLDPKPAAKRGSSFREDM